MADKRLTIKDIMNACFDETNGVLDVSGWGSGGSLTNGRFTINDILNESFDQSTDTLKVGN